MSTIKSALSGITHYIESAEMFSDTAPAGKQQHTLMGENGTRVVFAANKGDKQVWVLVAQFRDDLGREIVTAGAYRADAAREHYRKLLDLGLTPS